MIRSLDDFKKKDDDKKKKPTTSYAGGEKSGMAVENASPDDDLENLINKAKKGGQEHASEGKGGSPKTELKITLYANGFVVDDGPFRAYTEPVN